MARPDGFNYEIAQKLRFSKVNVKAIGKNPIIKEILVGIVQTGRNSRIRTSHISRLRKSDSYEQSENKPPQTELSNAEEKTIL
ncbi:hypothetical protein TNCT_317911 [Trichonephila clavata]|uniref:Uncharacterized protein n=1 Tax=Trichonephila clavata TaxID=2740835 RepID=A0A8X6GSK1_TRICU|nr:hypothetical protein TNCT_317911 [Trichonephila clavata]